MHSQSLSLDIVHRCFSYLFIVLFSSPSSVGGWGDRMRSGPAPGGGPFMLANMTEYPGRMMVNLLPIKQCKTSVR